MNFISGDFKYTNLGFGSYEPVSMCTHSVTLLQFHTYWLHMEMQYFALRNLFLKFAVNFFNQNVKAMPGNKQMP